MGMTCRELIEHLAQYDGDTEVYVRDPEHILTIAPLLDHAIEYESIRHSYDQDVKQVLVLG